MIDILIELEKKGWLKKLIKAGYLSAKILLHYEVFLEVDKLKRTTTKKTMEITSEVAEKFRISETYVFVIMRSLK